MQLLVIALLLMLSGKNPNLKELRPIIEEYGGEKAAAAFKQAEELSGVISALQSVMPASPAPHEKSAPVNEGAGEGYPLAPVANIADEKITRCLSRYIALGE